MEFAWNTQKNKISDVKGKEMEQDRKGRKSNPDIDDTRTDMNYDLVESFTLTPLNFKTSFLKIFRSFSMYLVYPCWCH